MTALSYSLAPKPGYSIVWQGVLDLMKFMPGTAVLVITIGPFRGHEDATAFREGLWWEMLLHMDEACYFGLARLKRC